MKNAAIQYNKTFVICVIV